MILQMLPRVFVSAFLLVVGSCASSGGRADVVQLHHTGETCICGTPDGDFLGCHEPLDVLSRIKAFGLCLNPVKGTFRL